MDLNHNILKKIEEKLDSSDIDFQLNNNQIEAIHKNKVIYQFPYYFMVSTYASYPKILHPVDRDIEAYEITRGTSVTSVASGASGLTIHLNRKELMKINSLCMEYTLSVRIK